MKEFKNKKIKIFDTTYKIIFKDKVFNDEDRWVYGCCCQCKKEILISLKCYDDSPLYVNEIETTIMHEIIHAILDECCYVEISSNEPAVEWLAKCLIQLKKQKIFEI